MTLVLHLSGMGALDQDRLLRQLELPVPRLAPDLPPVGGRTRVCAADFFVEEIPAYEPCGHGDHLFLWVEKRELPARALLHHVATALGLPHTAIGHAGLKDTKAVTRQYLSVPALCLEHLHRLEREPLRVLRVERHRHKLRTGHLLGNRFRLVVREAGPGGLARAAALLQRVQSVGLPNHYGQQRFGRQLATVRTGLTLLRGDLTRRRRPDRQLRRLALSAVQGAVFNCYLSRRMQDGLLPRVLDGEVLQVGERRRFRLTTDPTADQAALEAHQVVPAGPIQGPRMPDTRGTAGARERILLAELGLAAELFTGHGKLLRGTRRPNQVWPGELRLEEQEDSLVLCCRLPPGSYASVLLEQLGVQA